MNTFKLAVLIAILFLPNFAASADLAADAIAKGDSLMEKSDYDAAIAAFNEALRINPKSSIAYSNRGRAYYYQGNPNKSIADNTEAIRLDPRNFIAYAGRGYSYEKKGAYDKAISDYSESIRLDPKHAESYYYRSNVFAKNGNQDKAVADLDLAVQLNPKSFPYREVRATMRIRQGDYDGGIADLQSAIGLDPNDPAAKFEAWQKEPLTPTALQHGELQVSQMLKDRPAMAQFGEKAKPLYQWAARKFAGEDLHENLFWDSFEPEGTDADHQIPTAARPGKIRIRRTYVEGKDKGKDQSFEALLA